MNKQTRKFYTRYRIYTSLGPAYLTGLLVFVSGWFTYNPTVGVFEKSIEITAGLAFFLACTGGFEVCSRLGFKRFRLQSFCVKQTPSHKTQLEAVFNDQFAAGQGMLPTLVELGKVPMLMVGGDAPEQLWLSTHTLENTPPLALQHLLAHERAHLDRDTMLDRVLVVGGYWWICGVSVMMLVGQPLFAALWLTVASGIFLRVNALRVSRLEQRADKLAVEATTLAGYASAMANYLEQFEAGNNHALVRGRLKRLGLPGEEIEKILDSPTGAGG